MAFGKEIKRIKLNQNLTAGRLAEILGVSQDRLNKWMQRDLNPKEEDVIKIEANLGMSLAEVMKLERLPVVQNVPYLGIDPEKELLKKRVQDLETIVELQKQLLNREKKIQEAELKRQRS